MHKENPSNTGHVARTIVAIILTFIGIAGSVQLLRSHLIEENVFLALSAGTSVICFSIAFIDRVQSFGSAAFKVELARVQESRKEVEAIEVRVRRIAHLVSEITLFFAAFQHRSLGDGDSETQRAWHETKVRELLKTTEATPEERSSVFRLFDAVKKMDEQRGSLDPAERERRWEEIRHQVTNEINRMA